MLCELSRSGEIYCHKIYIENAILPTGQIIRNRLFCNSEITDSNGQAKTRRYSQKSFPTNFKRRSTLFSLNAVRTFADSLAITARSDTVSYSKSFGYGKIEIYITSRVFFLFGFGFDQFWITKSLKNAFLVSKKREKQCDPLIVTCRHVLRE